MRANVEHNRVLHEHVVILWVDVLPVPYCRDGDRIRIDDLGYRDDGITHITASFGYMEDADVPTVLREAADRGLETSIDVDDAFYFLSRIELVPGDAAGMARWRKGLFVATSQVTADAAEYFGLPRERSLIVGSQITV